jgi:hypothetical protein
MTVTAATPIAGPHIADGVNRNWSYGFKILDAAHMRLEVSKADGSSPVVVSSGFTIAAPGINNDLGGTVVYPVAPVAALTAGKIVRPFRVVPLTQPNTIGNQGGFFPKTHEDTFDLLEMQIQQAASDAGRAYKAPLGMAGGLLGPISDGHVPIGLGGNLVDGPDADEIINAQAKALLAEAAAIRAELAAANVPGGLSIDLFGAVGANAALDTAALTAALATGRFAIVPGNKTYIFTPNTAQAATILSKFDNIVSEELIAITLPSGVMTFTGTSDIMPVGVNSSNIKLYGAAPIALTLTGVASVTGSAGAWTVVYNVASSTGVTVGDWLKNFEMSPLALLAGDNVVSYVLRDRPLPGELAAQVTNLGSITFAGSSATATFSGSAYGDTLVSLAVNDLITCRGQTRQIATVGVDTCTFTTAFDFMGATAEKSFYHSLPNTGTITIAGTAVTGVGTLFLTEANVGDVLLCDGDLIEITAIASNTGLTLRKSKTVGAALPFTILVQAAFHNGGHEVTGVGVGTVTVLNKSRVKPPVNRVSGASMRVIKTVLKHTGTGDGMKFQQNASMPWMEAIAFQGNGGGGVGIAMNGRVPALPLSGGGSFGSITQHGYTTSMVCGQDVVVANWAYNVFLGHGCILNARTIALSGGTLINLWQMEGSFANVRRAVISGSAAHGHGVNGGSGALVTEAQFISNASDGLRAEVGATIYGEGAIFLGNQGMNIRVSEGGDFYCGGGVSMLAGVSGLIGVNAGATLNDFIVAANRASGIDCRGYGDYVMDGTWFTGNVSSGIVSTTANISALNSSITGNGGTGAYSISDGTILMNGSYQRGNALGIYSENSRVSAISCQNQPVQVGGRNAVIDVSTPVGPAPTLTGVTRINEYTNNGNIIRDAAPVSGFGVAGVRPNGGSNISFFKGVTSVQDCGSVAANGQLALPLDITITGANPVGMTAQVGSNYVDASITFIAQIVAADTVRVYAVNSSAGAINPGNATYTVTVTGFTA